MRAIAPAPGLAALAGRFDGFIIDQSLIVRDDKSLYPAALEALQQLRDGGKRVLVLANSGRSDRFNSERLQRLGVGAELYERLLSTGQLMQQALIAQSLSGIDGDRRYFVVGQPQHLADFDSGRLKRAATLEEANAIVLLGLNRAEMVDASQLGWLEGAAKRGLPLYSARADVHGLAPVGKLAPGFGAVLYRYRAAGGEVFLYGKPSGRVYARCLNILDPIETDRIASIGNQFPSDIIGAREMGIEPIFVGTGAGGLKGNSPADLASWHAEMTRQCDARSIFELTVLPGLRW
jgi:HAD superfamily hydrolase (TIGR01459 family)